MIASCIYNLQAAEQRLNLKLGWNHPTHPGSSLHPVSAFTPSEGQKLTKQYRILIPSINNAWQMLATFNWFSTNQPASQPKEAGIQLRQEGSYHKCNIGFMDLIPAGNKVLASLYSVFLSGSAFFYRYWSYHTPFRRNNRSRALLNI